MIDDQKGSEAPPKEPSADPQPQDTPELSPAEHPRRVNPQRRRHSDKQLRPERVRGGFDTK